MRFKLLRRFALGLGARASTGLLIILPCLFVIGIVFDGDLRGIDSLVQQVVQVEEPTSAAAYEMEINFLGAGLSVLKYLGSGDAEHRASVDDDQDDFQRFRAEYARLANTPEEQQLGGQIDALHARYVRFGRELMDARDEQSTHLTATEAVSARLLAVLRQEPAERGVPRAPSGLRTNLADLGSRMGLYLATSGEGYRLQLLDAIAVLRGELEALRGEAPAAAGSSASALAEPLEAVLTGTEAVVGLQGQLQQAEAELISLRRELDDLLDEGIQALTRQDLARAQADVTSSIGRLRGISWVLLGLAGVVCLGALGAITYRSAQLYAANQELVGEIGRRERSEAARVRLVDALISAQEVERGRLTRELHDQMGQSLSTLMLGLKGLPHPSSPATPASSMSLEQLQDLTGRLIDQVHTIAWELRPAALDDLGLHGALGNYIEDWMQRTGCDVDFHSELEGVRLPEAVETALYRVAQEALTNVMKHAQAGTVSLTLQNRDSEVVMVIEDDGRGFLPEEPRSAGLQGPMGVLGMRERVGLVGGVLDLESAPGSGTTLVVRIPHRHAVQRRSGA